MKNVSIIINAVLAICIAILFYLYVSLKSGNTSSNSGANSNDIVTPKVFTDPSKLANAKIAYVNIDTLNEKYEFIGDYTKNIKARQANIEAQMSSMYNKFQQEYAEFQQAAQAGLRSEAELKKQQADLEQQQYAVSEKEKQLQSLGEEVAVRQAEMLKNVSEFIARYNKDKFDFILAYTSAIGSVLYAKPDLEITQAIVDGLNDEYRTKKLIKK